MTGLSYNEAVHTYIGATLITVAAMGAFLMDRPGSPGWRQHTWLALGLLLGWIVLGSNESWTPPAEGNVWWTPIVHLVTPNAAPSSWWDALAAPHVLQHKLAGLSIVTPALTEWYIRRQPDRPASRYLRWVLPVALLAVGVIFLVHRPAHRHARGTAMDPAAMRPELFQHIVFAAAFLSAGLTAFLARLPATAPHVSPRVWYAFMALGGLVFVTFRV